MRDQIRDILSEHCGGNIEAATDALCGLLGISDERDEWEHAGWIVRRKTGADFGRRGRVREMVGWQATHVETGHIEDYPPDAAGDVSVRLVKLSLDVKSQLYQLAGVFGS